MAEVVVPLHAPMERIEPVRSVRSTLLSGSLQALRARGMIDRYFEELPPEQHEEIRSMVAGVWIPLEIARAHYAVLDRLVESELDQVEMGRDVADRIHRTILATVARAATGAGVTPWMGLSMFPKLMERTFVGGGVTISKLSPKDARVEVVRLSLLEDSSYFRNAFRGVLAGGIELFCRRAFVNDLSKRGEVHAFKVSWA